MIVPGRFILDPTGIYPAPDGVVVISSERQWLECVGRSDRTFWVKGEWLSKWTREWLRHRGSMDLIVDEKRFPRPKLQGYLKNVPIPPEWDDDKVLQLLRQLESYAYEDPIPYLLSDRVGDSHNLWFAPPTIEHLAQVLSLDISPDLRPFVRVWAEGLREQSDAEWIRFYKSEKPTEVLRAWLGLVDTEKPCEQFPGEVPPGLVAEFDSSWRNRIVETSGAALDDLEIPRQCGMKRIADVAASILRNKSSWVSPSRVRKLAPFLDARLVQQLLTLVPPAAPALLPLDAPPLVAMRWATEEYLPFRRWQALNEPNASKDLVESAADSFVNWLLAVYPTIKLDPVPQSVLNYSVASLVAETGIHSPVLWVVVDGLGWNEHIELARMLCTLRGFKVVHKTEPRIGILPTKTEYAKWSLFSQLLPSHPSWEPDAGKGFKSSAESERYTDAPSRREALEADLKSGSRRVYCWDTTEYDSLFHRETIWKHLAEVSVPNKLAWIANEISYLVALHPLPGSVRIVLCSDHGQLIGQHQELSAVPTQLESGGRIAHGRVQDERFVILDAGRYGVPADISVVRGDGCIRPFQTSQAGETIGNHGGLLPEEVIVGVSMLQLGAERHPITVICRGSSKANRPGLLEIEITNPNNAQISDGYIYVEEIPELLGGKPVSLNIEPFGRGVARLAIEQWPELPLGISGNSFRLSGSLHFNFGGVENGVAQISASSSIEVTQMFRSGLDIDDFF